MARSISAGSCSASIAVPAITLATCTRPLCAAGILPWAVSCQEWNGVPTAQVAPRACTVGTTQQTSPTSVEPFRPRPWPRAARRSRTAAAPAAPAPRRGVGGGDVFGAERRADFAGVGAVRLVERRRPEALEVFVHRLLQRRVAHQVGDRADHLGRHLRLGHQRRAVGDLAHPGDQLRQRRQVARRGSGSAPWPGACTTFGAMPPASR